jgi:hypothetical protein
MRVSGDKARKLSEYMCKLRRSHVTEVPTDDSLRLETAISRKKT